MLALGRVNRIGRVAAVADHAPTARYSARVISKGVIPALFLALLLGLAACGSDDSSAGGDGGDSGGSEVAAPGSAAGACSDETVSSAPEYTEGSAEVTVFTDAGDGYDFTPYSGELPDGTESIIPEEASVIVCMEVTASEVVEGCEFNDDDSGESFTEELADATYNVTVLSPRPVMSWSAMCSAPRPATAASSPASIPAKAHASNTPSPARS